MSLFLFRWSKAETASCWILNVYIWDRNVLPSNSHSFREETIAIHPCRCCWSAVLHLHGHYEIFIISFHSLIKIYIGNVTLRIGDASAIMSTTQLCHGYRCVHIIRYSSQIVIKLATHRLIILDLLLFNFMHGYYWKIFAVGCLKISTQVNGTWQIQMDCGNFHSSWVGRTGNWICLWVEPFFETRQWRRVPESCVGDGWKQRLIR